MTALEEHETRIERDKEAARRLLDRVDTDSSACIRDCLDIVSNDDSSYHLRQFLIYIAVKAAVASEQVELTHKLRVLFDEVTAYDEDEGTSKQTSEMTCRIAGFVDAAIPSSSTF